MERLIEGLARRSGEIALGYYGKIKPDEKDDMSYVTEGDRRVEEFLRTELSKEFPEDRIIGEEEGDVGEESEYCWAIDPIDGTTNFVAGLPHWGVCIARLKDGVPVFGTVFIPVLDQLYMGGLGMVSTCNDVAITPAKNVRWHHEELVGVWSKSFENFWMDFPGKIRVIGSTVIKLLYVAQGSYIGAMIPPVRLWDVAAGLPILLGAGGQCEWLDGADVNELDITPGGEFRTPPMIAAAPGIMDRLRKATHWEIGDSEQ